MLAETRLAQTQLKLRYDGLKCLELRWFKVP